MWPVLLALGALVVAGAGSPSPSRQGPSAPIAGPPPPRPQPAGTSFGSGASRTPKTAHRPTPHHGKTRTPKVTTADVTFAVELARIHEPNPATLRQFGVLLRSHGFQAAAKELMAKTLTPGTYTATTAPNTRGGIPVHAHLPRAPMGKLHLGKRGGGEGMRMGRTPTGLPATGSGGAVAQPPSQGSGNSGGGSQSGSGSGTGYGSGSQGDTQSPLTSSSNSSDSGDGGSGIAGDDLPSNEGDDASVSGFTGRRRREIRGRVGDWYDTMFGDLIAQLENSHTDQYGEGEPDDPPGPPGWMSIGHGLYLDPVSGTGYYYDDAWEAYQWRSAHPSVNGPIRRRSARVGDAPSDGPSVPTTSSLSPSSPNSLTNLQSALPKNLPNIGQLSSQISTGASLLSQIQGSTASDASGQAALGLGEAAASTAAGILNNLGPRGKEVAGILEGAVAGASAGAALGPYGAAAGAVIGAVAGFLEDEFGGSPLPPIAVNATDATRAISAAIVGWNQAWGQTPDGKPQGWHMADWCSAAFPPYKMDSFDGKRLFRLTYQITTWATPFDTQSLLLDHRHFAGAVFGAAAGDPTVYNFVHRDSNATSFEGKPFDYLTLVSWQVPVCSGAFWDWWNPDDMGTDCATSTGGADNDEDTVTALTYPDAEQWIPGIGHTSGPQGTAANMLKIWTQMTAARGGKSVSQIVSSAQKRRPSALWFSADLYGAWLPSSGQMVSDDWSTVYWDCDLFNAMATVLGMLSVGSDTRAICAELMLQVNILHDSGAKAFSAGNVSPGVRELLDDYLYMAHQEDWAANSKRRSFVQWVAHYIALASATERSLARAWFGGGYKASGASLSTFRLQLEKANT